MVVRVGFEPTYATRADLQSAAFNHSATSPDCHLVCLSLKNFDLSITEQPISGLRKRRVFVNKEVTSWPQKQLKSANAFKSNKLAIVPHES